MEKVSPEQYNASLRDARLAPATKNAQIFGRGKTVAELAGVYTEALSFSTALLPDQVRIFGEEENSFAGS